MQIYSCSRFHSNPLSNTCFNVVAIGTSSFLFETFFRCIFHFLLSWIVPDLGIEMKPILEMSQEEHPAENFYFIKNNGKCISTLAYTSRKIYVFFVDNHCEFVGNL